MNSYPKLTILEKIKIAFHYLLPAKMLTEFAGFLAKKELKFVTTFAIKLFSKAYGINLNQAQISEARGFKTFNEFFTRQLKEGSRPICEDENAISSPSDGFLSQCGKIENNTLLQAKGHNFSLSTLLAKDKELAKHFEQGSYSIVYLSPKDYHRVHMPCDATLVKTIYVPGELFSVNPFLSHHIPDIFARNERLICEFDTKFGKMVQILVGATITGSLITTWAGCVNTKRLQDVKVVDYQNQNISFKKGDEMGAFALGSTVVNLFEKEICFEIERKQQAVQMGEKIAQFS